MAVYKDGDKWRVIYRYTNWNGERKQAQKRGFATKREAQAWEHEAMLKQDANLDMTFESFFEIYKADKIKRLKANTWEAYAQYGQHESGASEKEGSRQRTGRT